jgi:hypothetical protein
MFYRRRRPTACRVEGNSSKVQDQFGCSLFSSFLPLSYRSRVASSTLLPIALGRKVDHQTVQLPTT